MRLNDKDRKEVVRAFGLLSHVGITMSACIIGSLLFGRFLDSKLGTSPLFIIIFTLLGVAAAIFSLYQIASKTWKDK